MTPFFSSLDTAEPAPLHDTAQVAQPFVRLMGEALSSLSDTDLRKYETGCFEQFQLSTMNDTKSDWLHALASAIVEMTNRGLSLNGERQ